MPWQYSLAHLGLKAAAPLEVFTAQKRQPRVHVSPISIMVAVAVCPSPRPPPLLAARLSQAQLSGGIKHSMAPSRLSTLCTIQTEGFFRSPLGGSPALPNVGTPSLFAHCVQLELP